MACTRNISPQQYMASHALIKASGLIHAQPYILANVPSSHNSNFGSCHNHCSPHYNYHDTFHNSYDGLWFLY